MMHQKSNKIKWGIGLVMALFSISLFVLNALAPYLPGDDYIFQLKFPESGIIGAEPISSLSDLIESQFNFYRNYHYRILNHTVLQILLLLPAWIFDLLNTLVFLVLPLCVLRIKKNGVTIDRYLLILFFIWLFHFDLGRCYFLTTGSLNYSWLLVPQLLYVSALFRRWESRTGVEKNTALLLALAFINFTSNENVQVVLFLMTALVGWQLKKDKVVWVCAAVLMLGGLFMLSSPSIGVRLEEQGFREAGMISHIMEYGKRVAFYLWKFVPVLILYFVLKKRRGFKWRDKKSLLLAGVAMSLFVMIFIPLFEPRSAVFGFFLLLMWVVRTTSDQVNPKLLWILILLGMTTFILRLPSFVRLDIRTTANEELLKSEKQIVELMPYCEKVRRSYLLCYPLSEDPDFVDNKSMAAVYEKTAVSKIGIDYSKVNPNHYSPTSVAGVLTHRYEDEMRLLIETEQKQDFFIVRGLRRGVNVHRLVSFLPLKLQLHFLDILEDITKDNQPKVSSEEKTYNFVEINPMAPYQYFLISKYDMEKHCPVGEVQKLVIAKRK